MSSLRNAVKRRTHKERAQPSARRRLGLLEKHKDYVLRAKNFHRKEDAIRKLKQKAALRNPDEFYFAMEHTRLVGGEHRREGGGQQWSEEELRLMNTQDVRYLQTKAQMEHKRIEKLQACLHLIGQPAENRHIVFEDPDEEADGISGLSARLAGSHTPGPHAQPRISDDGSGSASFPHEVGRGSAAANNLGGNEMVDDDKGKDGMASSEVQPVPKKLQRKVAARYNEVEQRKERATRLDRMVEHLALKRALMGKGRRDKVEPVSDEQAEAQSVYKWHSQRKK